MAGLRADGASHVARSGRRCQERAERGRMRHGLRARPPLPPFGFGVVDQGAQRSASGRGTVDAFAGDVVAINPGEVHDGRPLGGPLRTWRTVYLEPDLMEALGAPRDTAIIRP